jgi:hypothetical protein
LLAHNTQPHKSDKCLVRFDAPLASELQDHQQAQAATQQASPNGNPFDEPLASEKADAQVKLNPEQEAFNLQQSAVSGLTGMPTPNMSDQDRASFERGKMAGAVSVPLVAGGMSAAPLLGAIGEHLGMIKSIIDTASKIGIGSLGYKEARELYKEFVAGGKK